MLQATFLPRYRHGGEEKHPVGIERASEGEAGQEP